MNMPSREGYYWFDGDPQSPPFGTLGFYQGMMYDLLNVHWEDVVNYPPDFPETPERWGELDELMEGLCIDQSRFLLGTSLGNSEVIQILWEVDQCQQYRCKLTYEQCIRGSELMTLHLEF